MDGREQRGMEIAARFKIAKRERDWSVPSQTGEGRYTVSGVDADAPRCTCPDFEDRQQPCKHIYAVRIVIQREFSFDGETVTERETVTITKTVKRTYPQNWPAYNAAQTNEKDRFMVLLRDLCAGLPEPEQKRGQPRLSVKDSVFTAVMKVYTTASARHLRIVVRSQVRCAPAPALVGQGAHHVRRQDERGHAVEIHDKNAYDGKQLPALVETTARTFAIAEVSADKAYGSTRNADVIANTGGTPFIAFKSNATGTGSHRAGNMGTGAWEKAYGYFLYRREEFMAHYHKRSNVETTFSMVKRKFGHPLRSKTETAQVNETLAKILCHNLVVLIHEMYELGIDPVFWNADQRAG